MLIFGIIIFTLLSAMFSGVEIAFVSANRVGIEIEKNKKSLKARILSSFYNKPKEFIGVMLIGNNISLVILTFLFNKVLSPYTSMISGNEVVKLLLETVIITLFLLLFAEFIPKTLFRAYANKIMTSLLYPIYFFNILLRIPTLFFTSLSTFLLKYVFKTEIEENDIKLTRIDLENFIDKNISEHDDIEKEMFQKALNLDQVKARDVMIPRNEIVTIDKTAKKKKLIKTFNNSKHSRIIIIDSDVENVLGYIHHQQLFIKDFKNIEDNIMPISFIPETMNAKDLLMQFIKNTQNISIIVDEYGSVAGLITLEDLIEEIFGEIEDEYDKEDSIEKKLENNEYLFSGRLEIDYINEKYDALSLPKDEYNTLSGLIVMTSGKIPLVGDEIKIGNYKFKILKVSEKKVDLLRLSKLDFNAKSEIEK